MGRGTKKKPLLHVCNAYVIDKDPLTLLLQNVKLIVHFGGLMQYEYDL